MVLVAFASKHGATREIAEAIAEGLGRRGLRARAAPVDEVTAVDAFDAVVLGSAVYYGHWLEPARTLAEGAAAALAARPVWLFSSGPLGEQPAEDPVDVADLMEVTGAVGHRVLAGRLDRASLGFRDKAVVVALRAPEGDFRDWAAIDAFAAEVAERLRARAPDQEPTRPLSSA
jgi:menaquinone-dependent protoporphyrinogen oxidase